MHKMALSVAGVGTLLLGAMASPSATASDRCPSGAVCIRDADGSVGENTFSSYGAHNLSNVTGERRITNSQTGGAGYELCYGYNGTNCKGWVNRHTDYDYSFNFTPINSVILVK
ncbi:hypothetical protein [Streptomyces acidicola]|uniref:hypothetical protein n=1 Tax=Streptomyces acidicola TaxID=2596892 RepID=UPI00342ABE63